VPFLEQETITITVENNLQQNNNYITLNLLSVNNQTDQSITNNSASAFTNLESNYDNITLIINPDNYPEETSWEFVNENTGKMVSSGSLENGDQYIENICIDYSSCFSLYFYDSYGDGICCGYGNGDFMVLNSSGNQLVTNDGVFHSKVVELFCPDGSGCGVTANVNIYHTSSPNEEDGVITINTSSGLNPFSFSIDGGQSFSSSNSFSELSPGIYDVVVQGALGLCEFEETVTIEVCEFTSAQITSTNASSVVSTNGSIEINPTSGTGPYLYSIDGGQNFVPSNTFNNLPVGTYNIIVQDNLNICHYEQAVPIEAEEVSNNKELSFRVIKLYPNPTQNNFIVDIETDNQHNEKIEIQVYDYFGRVIKTGIIADNHNSKIRISLGKFSAGTYFVKCFNNSFEKHFKLIKL
jgi:hypothetical protein